MRKELLCRSRYDWVQPRRDQDGIGKIHITDSRFKERRKWPTLVGLMSYSACHTFPPAVFLAFLAPFVYVAQNLRIPTIFELSELKPATACVSLILFLFICVLM